MNVFKIEPGGVTDLSTQVARLAPPRSRIGVVEVDIDGDSRPAFAREVANLIAASRSSTVTERTAQGYQLGSTASEHTTRFRLFFME